MLLDAPLMMFERITRDEDAPRPLDQPNSSHGRAAQRGYFDTPFGEHRPDSRS